MLQVYDRVIPNSSVDTLIVLVFGVFIALILETIMRIARAWVSAWSDARLEYNANLCAFKKILSAKYAYVSRRGSGTQLDSLNALNTLKDFYGGQFVTTVSDIPFVLVFIALIAYLGGYLALVPIISIVLFLFLTLSCGRALKSQLLNKAKADGRRMDFIIEVLKGFHTIKSNSVEAQMLRRYEKLQERCASDGQRMTILNARNAHIGALISQANMVAIVSYGSVLVINGQLTVGGLAACTLLSGRTILPMVRAASLWIRLQTLQTAKKRISPIVNYPDECVPNAQKIGEIQGNIAIKSLYFKYQNEGPYILKNINMQIKSGETIALKGEKASGKNTLLNVIGGLYHPLAGEVIIDGKDIFKCDLVEYRKHIAYMPKSGQLFAGTILDNITLFRKGPYLKKALQICELIGLHDEIHQMQEGYFTVVGEGSVDAIPRGLVQRISIARSLIESPSILLFNEANASLDIRSDILLRQALLRLKTKCTIIMITHRPSMMLLADRVYTIKNGEIVHIDEEK